MNRLLVFGLLLGGLLLRQSTQAQTPLAIGEWETLQSFQRGTYVTQNEESIIYTTGRAVFYLDKDELSITTLTRDDGLSETDIRLLRYHEPTQTLVIVYENSVIDLLRDGRFSTLRQINNFNFSGGDNSVNRLFFDDDNNMYLAAGYGVSALNLDDETFVFTTFAPLPIASVATYRDTLYAATQEGLYGVPLRGGNINDFNTWELVELPSGPMDYSGKAVNVWNDELYFGVDEDVWRWNQGNPELFYDADQRNWELAYLDAEAENLLAGYRFLSSDNQDRGLVLLEADGGAFSVSLNCLTRPTSAIQDGRGRIWLGDEGGGIRYLPNPMASCDILRYPGPISDRNYRLEHDGEALWVASGTLTPNLSPTFNSQGLFRYEGGNWTAYNRSNNQVLSGRDGVARTGDDFLDIVGVAVDPFSNLIWGGSYYEGAFSLDPATEEIILYDELNSTLQNAQPEAPGRLRVGQPAVDRDGNVYFPNALAENGDILHVRTPAGEWAALGGDCTSNEAFAVAIDGAGFAWVLHGTFRGNGISIIDTKGTPLDPSDDECRNLNTGNSNLVNNEVRSIAVDLDDNVWIGTSTGVMVFDCGSLALDPNVCSGETIAVFDEFDNGGLLLETEDCLGITIDGANRKWVATSGGAYLLSADGQEQLAFFDEDNSPLLNNLVRDIAINPRDGTVFFGTESGIISYRSDATVAGRQHREPLKVFPNPVEPGYRGPIAIDGLVRDARVKITDLSGRLVFETNALGGQVRWDGTDYNGRRVQTGVYLVFSSTNGGLSFNLPDPESAVGKIVFIR